MWRNRSPFELNWIVQGAQRASKFGEDVDSLNQFESQQLSELFIQPNVCRRIQIERF